MKIEGLIKKSMSLIDDLEKTNKKIAKTIVKTLKDIIPDIDYSIGWYEYGIDTICFYSKSKDVTNGIEGKSEELRRIIEEVFSDTYPLQFDCPYGIYLNDKEAKMVRDKLIKLKDKNL